MMVKAIELTREWLESTTHVENGCWIHVNKPNRGGYARVMSHRIQIRLHRLAYELYIGPIPTGLQIDHLCRNRRCVNPWHLEVVTNHVNTLRGNNFIAQKARQTHCVHGHPFDLVNTYWRSNGARSCRTCLRVNSNRKYWRNPEPLRAKQRERQRIRASKAALRCTPSPKGAAAEFEGDIVRRLPSATESGAGLG